MSLDKSQVVPVDTHVLQIAIRDYSIPGNVFYRLLLEIILYLVMYSIDCY